MDKIIYDPDFAVVIKAYRQSLIQRYSRENISKYKEFSRIKQETIDKLTTYFLELLYPEYEVRLKLDNAFDSLAGFVNSPSKFLGLLGNIGYAIFKFGRHLTSAIRAGMAALSSYLVAHKFERDLLINGKEMIRQGIDITQETNFELLVSKIPKEEADKLFNGLSAGGKIEMPIADSPWGSYFGMFRDKYGIEWMVSFNSK